MKKSVLILLLLTVSLSSFAQLSFGVKAGLNISKIAMSDNQFGFETESTTGLHAGVFAQLPVKGKFSFIPELQFSQRGANVPGAEKITFSYLELPLLFSFAPVKAIGIDLGPGVAYRLSSTIKTPNAFDEKFDFGIHAGIRVNLTEHFLLIARYYYGLTAIDEVSYNTGPNINDPVVRYSMFNRGFQFGVGYKIGSW